MNKGELLSMEYTKQEVEDAIRGHILRFNKWIEELSEKDEVELKQILNEAYNEATKELKMRENKKFTSSSDFEDYILFYMIENKLEQAYVSLRYGYTEEQMNEQDFEIQVCSIHNFYALQWWLNWWEGQEFIEVQGILSPEIIRLLGNFEDAELFERLAKEN